MRSLIPERIRQIPESRLLLYREIEHENKSEARYAKTDDGKAWLLKSNMRGPEFLAESLGWLLAHRLNVPTPDGAATIYAGKPAWLSALIRQVDYWDASKMSAIHNISEIGSMLALDALVYNEDRHHRNILLEPDPDEYTVKVWSIDLADAEIGRPLGLERIGLTLPSANYIARGIPLDAIREQAMRTADLAMQIKPDDLRADVVESCGLASERNVDPLYTGLLRRCQNARTLVDQYLTAYGEVVE